MRYVYDIHSYDILLVDAPSIVKCQLGLLYLNIHWISTYGQPFEEQVLLKHIFEVWIFFISQVLESQLVTLDFV